VKKFTIELTYSAVEDLNNIPKDLLSSIISSFKHIAVQPFATSAKIKKLVGFKPPLYRVRSGDYRIIYRIEDSIIVIMRVINRKDLEKTIQSLKLSKV
jgi:mRNA interferase RelE/StbE